MENGNRTAFALSAPVLGRPKPGLRCAAARRAIGTVGGSGRRVSPRMHAAPGGEGYWRGEWICVDCGYLYKPGRRVKFEDQSKDWKCPQCGAPKRRFAKKAGSVIQETAGTSNTPIIVFSVLGLIATVAFGVWASTQL